MIRIRGKNNRRVIFVPAVIVLFTGMFFINMALIDRDNKSLANPSKQDVILLMEHHTAFKAFIARSGKGRIIDRLDRTREESLLKLLEEPVVLPDAVNTPLREDWVKDVFRSAQWYVFGICKKKAVMHERNPEYNFEYDRFFFYKGKDGFYYSYAIEPGGLCIRIMLDAARMDDIRKAVFAEA